MEKKNFYVNVRNNKQIVSALICTAKSAGLKRSELFENQKKPVWFAVYPNDTFSVFTNASIHPDLRFSIDEALEYFADLKAENEKPKFKVGDWVIARCVTHGLGTYIGKYKSGLVLSYWKPIQSEDFMDCDGTFDFIDRLATPEEIAEATKPKIEVGKYYKVPAGANFIGGHIIKITSMQDKDVKFKNLTDNSLSGWMQNGSPNLKSLIPATEEEIKQATRKFPFESDGLKIYDESGQCVKLTAPFNNNQTIFLDELTWQLIGEKKGWKIK